MQSQTKISRLISLCFLQGSLYAAFVTSTVANADIQSIDASVVMCLFRLLLMQNSYHSIQALGATGVVAFISAEDIPANGVNTFTGDPGVPSQYQVL